MWPMSTDCPRTFSQGIFLHPKLHSQQVIKLPVAGDNVEVSEASAVSLTSGYHRCGGAALGVLLGRPTQISRILQLAGHPRDRMGGGYLWGIRPVTPFSKFPWISKPQTQKLFSTF